MFGHHAQMTEHASGSGHINNKEDEPNPAQRFMTGRAYYERFAHGGPPMKVTLQTMQRRESRQQRKASAEGSDQAPPLTSGEGDG